jgi:glycosyltransferase involved in cell wall biosynthesis
LIVPRLWKARGLGHAYRASPYPGSYRGAAVHPLATIASGRNSFFLWVGLGALLRRLRPDAVYCWAEPWCLSAWQTARVARAALGSDIPLICYSAENRPKRLPWPFALLQRWTYARYAACSVPTPEISARVLASGFPGRIFVIPLWIRSRRALRADASALRLAYVGRLIPLKRVHLLVAALGLLPKYRLRIVGDGPERKRLEALAESLGLSARVEFLGHVGNEDLESALAGASLLVMPTAENPRQAEQFGKAAIEGVALGLPVLASRTGNLAVLAGQFPTLSARDLDTPVQVADAVARIFAAYPNAAALAEARDRAQADYGPAVAAERLQAAFRVLLGAAVGQSQGARP